MTTRERVLRLREQGLTYRQIAVRLGISESHASRCGSPRSYESTLRASREGKRRRRGVCVDCGGETRYNGHGQNVSQRCVACSAQRVAKANAGRGPRQRQLYALLDAGVDRYCELRDRLCITEGYMGSMLDRELRAGRIVRVARGRYARGEVRA